MTEQQKESITIIRKDWLQEFKADLFEGIPQKEMLNFINLTLDEHFPIWVKEALQEKDFDLALLYNSYAKRLQDVL